MGKMKRRCRTATPSTSQRLWENTLQHVPVFNERMTSLIHATARAEGAQPERALSDYSVTRSLSGPSAKKKRSATGGGIPLCARGGREEPPCDGMIGDRSFQGWPEGVVCRRADDQ